MAAELRYLIEAHTLNDQVRSLGYLPDEDISALYSGAVALVMPTFFGPTNIPFLEAWAMDRLREEQELDLVVLGHTHVPLLREAGPGRWYANTGDWVKHRSYLQLAQGCEPVLADWNGGRA